jgi:hypothetical protein
MMILLIFHAQRNSGGQRDPKVNHAPGVRQRDYGTFPPGHARNKESVNILFLDASHQFYELDHSFHRL